MMTQPIRTFKDLSSKAAPAGGNAKSGLSFEDSRLLEVRARTARTQLIADGLVDALLWVGRQWRRLIDGVRADFRLRAAEAQLYRMTDRELADLGLSRSDIHFAVREAAHGVAPEVDRFDGALEPANQNLRRAA
jgi:uncharacterized protein YjiS (DUF1127 family)